MVRTARLRLALIGAVVVFGHLLGLEWFGRQADKISSMPAMAPPMFTRLLQPATPPPPPVAAVAAAAPAPKPRPRAAPRPRPPASSAEALRRQKEAEEAEERARRQAAEEQLAAQAEAQAEEEAARAAAATASAPEQSASAPAPPASDAKSESASLDSWPTDTRLTYSLAGEWRGGPLYGDARVQWQRERENYQVRLDAKIQMLGETIFTSQGEVTPNGLLPRAYEELRPGKRRFTQIGDELVTLENGRTLPRPPGVQDTASQFVELSHRFATGRDVLEVGRSVTVWLARPGAVDQWTYDIVEREMLRTPQLGVVEAFHLKPRPIANPRGNITVEMWFAPSLQYLPVRVKVVMGSEAWLDLLVDRIEQR